MLFEPLDPNSRFRERRGTEPRPIGSDRRRAALIGAPFIVVGRVAGGGAKLVRAATPAAAAAGGRRGRLDRGQAPAVAPRRRRCRPRSAAFTSRSALASHPRQARSSSCGSRAPGLNTIELDVKDENGEIGFVPSAVPLARHVGAAKPYYSRARRVRLARKHGLYLIGRVVVFEDPLLAAGRPGLAVSGRTAPSGTSSAGLGWTNPYNRRRLEVQRRRSRRSPPGRLRRDPARLRPLSVRRRHGQRRLSGQDRDAAGWVIPQFVQYAAKRLKRLGVRVSADVFGLSASRDLGIGQIPRRISRYVDAIYPMVYPRTTTRASTGSPTRTRSRARRCSPRSRTSGASCAGRQAEIIPWLQDFSLGAPTASATYAPRSSPLGSRTRTVPALESVRPLHRRRLCPSGLGPTDPLARIVARNPEGVRFAAAALVSRRDSPRSLASFFRSQRSIAAVAARACRGRGRAGGRRGAARTRSISGMTRSRPSAAARDRPRRRSPSAAAPPPQLARPATGSLCGDAQAPTPAARAAASPSTPPTRSTSTRSTVPSTRTCRPSACQ